MVVLKLFLSGST